MAEFNNVLLLAGDAVLYFVALAALLRARSRIGHTPTRGRSSERLTMTQ